MWHAVVRLILDKFAKITKMASSYLIDLVLLFCAQRS